MRRRSGYILFEAVMAMGLLSIGVVSIQAALRQAIVTRAQARDITEARFFLERVISTIELQPQLVEGTDSGVFTEEGGRFRWKSEVTRVDIPQPEIPPDLGELLEDDAKLKVKYLVRIQATVMWKRFGRDYEETFKTLWVSDKLYVPKDELQD